MVGLGYISCVKIPAYTTGLKSVENFEGFERLAPLALPICDHLK